jgi:hypothetical protein
MATVYNNELTVGSVLLGTAQAGSPLSAFNVTQVEYKAASNDAARVLFDTATPLTTSALLTATYANTAGTTLSSGTGTIVFNTAYNSTPAYVILQDRTSFSLTLGSGARTLTSNGFEAWGPTERRLRHLEYI